MSLTGKHVLLGVTGGIAAYKATDIVRKLKAQGADVRVIMTKNSQEIIPKLTIEALSGYPVHDDIMDKEAGGHITHIEMAKWADLTLVAPCTANVLAKLRIGLADDLLTSTCLACPNPIAVSPAMNTVMYLAPPTQENISVLKQRGFLVWGPASGSQACGDVGPGRMLDPALIVDEVVNFFKPKLDLSNSRILITAGPTQEPLDPVRYISNYSSGKMGFAIASAAAQCGAKVTLISGPVSLPTPTNTERINVRSACDMHKAVHDRVKDCTIFISCAAVADYRAETIQTEKMKKTSDEDGLTIKLVKNPDIVASVGALPAETRPFVVGFAAETQNVEEYARKKLKDKNLDMICANDVSKEGLGFNSDDNALVVYTKAGQTHELPPQSKTTLAQALLEVISQTIAH
ncbi:putative Coenzyme A biosynthesis bifunctional protein CoaBC [Blattamonas nauphoetae]|uniref:Coenzyme A biosynthesis bifunctional protein CoaBC n=1 Tax=Blattamonas nauphoetae TaxID=2049346 RepID=A0ABQ9Y664_9EUKA|nr:putative Coenzyme A biosynthesis bifunctional protein CoaBC [Blattamonas nauphoetae]